MILKFKYIKWNIKILSLIYLGNILNEGKNMRKQIK